MKKFIVAIIVLTFGVANAQEITNDQKITNDQIKKAVAHYMDSINKAKPVVVKETEKKEHWYDVFSIRGYAQVRYNGLFSTNDKVSCDQCDKSWGTTSSDPDAKSNNGFFVR